jgi:hypothetical protein
MAHFLRQPRYPLAREAPASLSSDGAERQEGIMRVLSGFSMALLVVAMAASPARANVTWTVGAGANCDAHTIQDAVNLAAQSQTTDAKFIEIASDQDYSAQSIHVDNLSVGFVGGPVTCHSSFTSDPPAISGNGGSGSVFLITGTGDVSFYHLEILDGDSAAGGGINFVGNGSLSLTDVLIDFNAADNGGGISASSDGSLDIYINENTSILRNTARDSGGGIEAHGNVYVYALRPTTLIGFNHAANYGGGVSTIAPAQLTLGSSGLGALPVVFSNTAQRGGGVSLRADGDVIGQVLMFAMDSGGAVGVGDNYASVAGGGFYLLPDIEPINARLCAQDFLINGNGSPQGAAIFLDWSTSADQIDAGGEAYFNPDDGCDPEALGAVHCAAGIACNEMSANVATDASENPSGPIVYVGTSALFSGRRFSAESNVGTNLLLAAGNNDFTGGAALRSCLTAGNQFSGELIHMQNDDNVLYIDQCTFAPDIIDATHVIAFDNAGGNQITMMNTIVDEPGTLTLAQPGIDQSIENILTNDDSTLPSRPDIVVGAPDFVDGSNGNFRQLPSSLGVDFAIASGGVDLDGNARDVDLPETPNFLGPRDLGAYETQRTFACGAADTIYCDGFDGN